MVNVNTFYSAYEFLLHPMEYLRNSHIKSRNVIQVPREFLHNLLTWKIEQINVTIDFIQIYSKSFKTLGGSYTLRNESYFFSMG